MCCARQYRGGAQRWLWRSGSRIDLRICGESALPRILRRRRLYILLVCLRSFYALYNIPMIAIRFGLTVASCCTGLCREETTCCAAATPRRMPEKRMTVGANRRSSKQSYIKTCCSSNVPRACILARVKHAARHDAAAHASDKDYSCTTDMFRLCSNAMQDTNPMVENDFQSE